MGVGIVTSLAAIRVCVAWLPSSEYLLAAPGMIGITSSVRRLDARGFMKNGGKSPQSQWKTLGWS